MNFKGKTAISTGAASGMGLLFAQSFASLGGNVVMCDVNEEVLNEKVNEINSLKKGRALAALCDVRDYKQVCSVRDKAVEAFGSIDIMAGSFCRLKYSPDASNMFAMMPEKNPIHMFLIMKGRLIKPHVAPTSFMVCSRNRLEYIDNLTRLPMSDHEISVSITNSAINNNPARCMLLFIVSTRSFW